MSELYDFWPEDTTSQSGGQDYWPGDESKVIAGAGTPDSMLQLAEYTRQTTEARNTTNITVETLQIIQTGRYQQMWNRPYQLEMETRDMNDLMNRIDQSGPHGLNPGGLADIAGQLLRPTATPNQQIMVPNGWGETRGCFMLKIRTKNVFGSEVIYLLQGFTDKFDLSYTDEIDPHTQLTANSYMKIVVNNGVETVVETAQVINNQWHVRNEDNHAFLLRPGDVFGGIHRLSLENSLKSSNLGGRVLDLSQGVLTSEGSLRENNIPSHYLARIVNAHQDAARAQSLNEESFGAVPGFDNLSHSARGNVPEANLFQNPFFRALEVVSGEINTTSFTLRDLAEVCDGQIRPVILREKPGTGVLSRPGDSESWANPRLETQIATQLLHMIPAITSRYFVMQMVFTCRNTNNFRQHECYVTGGQFLSTAPMQRYIDAITARVRTEVLPTISHNNEIDYQFTMQMNFVGDCVIDLTLGGGREVRYIAPCFCDSLLIPTITDSGQHLEHFAGDFSRFFDTINAASFSFDAYKGASGSPAPKIITGV